MNTQLKVLNHIRERQKRKRKEKRIEPSQVGGRPPLRKKLINVGNNKKIKINEQLRLLQPRRRSWSCRRHMELRWA